MASSFYFFWSTTNSSTLIPHEVDEYIFMLTWKILLSIKVYQAPNLSSWYEDMLQDGIYNCNINGIQPLNIFLSILYLSFVLLLLDWLRNFPCGMGIGHKHKIQYLLILNMREPIYLGLTISISWLLMPWLLASAGNQQPWYWLCKLHRSLSYMRKDFNYLYHDSMKEW